MGVTWFKMDFDSWHLKTQTMTAAELGAYMRLIWTYWRVGGLPNDDIKLARIARVSNRQWQALKGPLSEYFDADWKSTEIDEEISKLQMSVAAKSKSGLQGGVAKSLKYNNTGLANAKEMPDRYKNKIEDIEKEKDKKEKDQTIGLSETPNPQPKSAAGKSLALADKFFDDFWQAYPKREGSNPKAPALKSYLRATGTGKVSPAELLDAAKRYAASVNPADARFIPMASTWLNQERWTEHAGKPTGSSSSPSAVVSQLQVARTPVKETEKDYRDLLILYREKYGRSPMTVNGTVYYPTDWLDRHRVTGVQSTTNDLLREA